MAADVMIGIAKADGCDHSMSIASRPCSFAMVGSWMLRTYTESVAVKTA